MNQESNEKRALAPRLRFPEFQGEWVSSPMSKKYSFKGNNSLPRDKLNYEGGLFRNIHYGDIHTKFAPHFRVDSESVPYINDGESHSAIRPENYCAAGDMIFADASEDMADIGKAIEIIEAGDVPLVSGLHTILATPNGISFALGFGAYLFSSEGVRKQIQREAQGAKVLGLSATRLGNVKLHYPRKVDEQQKITDCLSSLDELIAAETKKLDILKTQKKGLVQQLFPREGEAIPRLRFPEFQDAGAWAETVLGDICEMKAGKFVAAAEIAEYQRDELYPCYGGNGLRGYTKSYTHSGRYSLVGRQGALCGNVNFVDGLFHATEHAIVTTPHSGISADWLFYELVLLNLNRFATGQAQPGLSVEVLEKVKCSVPKVEREQQKIADCLSSLDELIGAATQQLEALVTHKKGLMQQLFPVLDEVQR